MNRTKSSGRPEGGLESPVSTRNIHGENSQSPTKEKEKKGGEKGGQGERFEDLGLRLTTKA